MAVRLGLGVGDEFAEVTRLEPEFQDAVSHRIEALIPFGVSDVGEAREDPVDPLPLVVDRPCGPRPAELVASREERPHAWGASDLVLERSHPLRVPLLPEDVDSRLPLNRGLLRLEERVHDRAGAYRHRDSEESRPGEIGSGPRGTPWRLGVLPSVPRTP